MEEKLDLILITLTEMKQDISTLKQDVAILKDDVSVLKQDVAILKDEVSTLKQDVTILKDEVSTLKQDVAILKDEVSTLKQDVAILKDDVSTLKQNVTILKDDSSTLKQNDTIQNNNYHYLTSLVHNLAEKLENLTKQVTIMEKEHSEKLQVLLDQHIDCVRRHVSIACDLVEIEHTFAKHDARIYALEHAN